MDVIIFSEVMYDAANGISGESPSLIDFVKHKAIPMFESWGYDVLVLRANKDYLDVFNRVIEHPRKYASHKGMKYGFAISGLCSVKRDCKLKPINDFYSSLDDAYTEYVGIAVDERVRLHRMHKHPQKLSLLEKYGYSEEMAKELCEEYGLLSPTYDFTNRSGCWFCPNAKVEEHKEILRRYPDVWAEFVSLEKQEGVAQPKWNVFGDTLTERDMKVRYSQ